MSIKALLTKILNRLGSIKVYCTESGTANGWYYKKYSDGYGEAWYYNTFSISHYTTANGFYGYSVNGLNLPFTMASTYYQIDVYSQIGSGFAMMASARRSTTAVSPIYLLATSSGTQSVYICVHVYGKLA